MNQQRAYIYCVGDFEIDVNVNSISRSVFMHIQNDWNPLDCSWKGTVKLKLTQTFYIKIKQIRLITGTISEEESSLTPGQWMTGTSWGQRELIDPIHSRCCHGNILDSRDWRWNQSHAGFFHRWGESLRLGKSNETQNPFKWLQERSLTTVNHFWCQRFI